MVGWSDGWAVVTGASSGIGAALARRLAEERRALLLIARDADRLAAVADDCRALGASWVSVLLVDLRDRDRLAEGLAEAERERPIGLFVACAGILDWRHEGDLVETGATAARVLDVNLLATVAAVHLVLPPMLDRGRGAVLFVASLAGLAPVPDAPAYSASKAGLLSYGLALGEGLRRYGIRVAVACPGYVTTPMSRRHIGAHPGEIDADAAAEKILRGFERGREIIAFPFVLGWASRLALIAPPFLRRLAMATLRFHVAPDRDG